MSRIAVDCIALDDIPEWDDFVAAQAAGHVFLSRQWLQILADVFRFTPRLVVARTQDGIAGGIPLLLRSRGMLRVSPPPPITLYNGCLLADEQYHAGIPLAAVFEALVSRAGTEAHFISLALPSSASMAELFRRNGWRLQQRQSIVVDITDYSAAWQQFNQSLRRKIRRAEEQQLGFSETSDVDAVLALHQQSYARHNVLPPIPRDQLRSWLTQLRDARLVRMYLASLPYGRAIAARVVVPSGDVLFDWLAGADVGSADVAGSHWLVARILQEHAGGTQRFFDFMGANTPGVTDFKRSFGGSFVEYSIATFYRSAIVHSIEQIRNRFRKRH